MKLYGNIEVSGITKIVFYNTGEAWNRIDTDEEPVWVGDKDESLERVYSHKDMVEIVKRKANDLENYRIWTHGESMNIVPLDANDVAVL